MTQDNAYHGPLEGEPTPPPDPDPLDEAQQEGPAEPEPPPPALQEGDPGLPGEEADQGPQDEPGGVPADTGPEGVDEPTDALEGPLGGEEGVQADPGPQDEPESTPADIGPDLPTDSGEWDTPMGIADLERDLRAGPADAMPEGAEWRPPPSFEEQADQARQVDTEDTRPTGDLPGFEELATSGAMTPDMGPPPENMTPGADLSQVVLLLERILAQLEQMANDGGGPGI